MTDTKDEKYFKAIELLSQWSYESGVKIAIASMGEAEWVIAYEVPPSQPPPVVQKVPQVEIKGTPTILEAPAPKKRTYTKKTGVKKENVQDINKYNTFVHIMRTQLVIRPDVSIRSCELTEEVNKHLTFKMTNNKTTPQYMTQYIADNPGIVKKNGKTGVIYQGIGRRELEAPPVEREQVKKQVKKQNRLWQVPQEDEEEPRERKEEESEEDEDEIVPMKYNLITPGIGRKNGNTNTNTNKYEMVWDAGLTKPGKTYAPILM